MTGDQGKLFDAPELPGQLPLFGGPTMTADEIAKYAEVAEAARETAEAATQAGEPAIAEAATELAETAESVIERGLFRTQQTIAAARHADLIAHRRECGNCIPGARPCRAGRASENEYRAALDVLSAMERGEI